MLKRYGSCSSVEVYYVIAVNGGIQKLKACGSLLKILRYTGELTSWERNDPKKGRKHSWTVSVQVWQLFQNVDQFMYQSH